MKIGIKYCGGCNCHYDRTAAVKKMIKKWPNYTYSYTPETEFCDHCFIICGCPVACPETAALRTATWEKITSPRQLESAVSRLEKKTNIPPPTADALRPGQTCSVHRTYTLLHWQQMIRFLGLTSTGAYMHQGRPIVPEPLLTAPIALLLQKMNPVSWKILNTSFTFLGTAPIQEPLYCTLTVKEKQEITRVPHYVFTYTVTDTARKNFLTGTVYGKINET